MTKDNQGNKHLAMAIFDRAVDFFAVIAAAIIIFIMLTVVAEIIMRTFLNRSIIWVLEINQNNLLFMTLFVAPWILRKEGHVRIDIVYQKLRPRVQRILDIVISNICIVVCFILIWYGVKVTWDQYQTGAFIVSLVEIPTWTVVWVIPFGFLMLGIQFIRRTYGFIRGAKVSLKKEVETL